MSRVLFREDESTQPRDKALRRVLPESIRSIQRMRREPRRSPRARRQRCLAARYRLVRPSPDLVLRLSFRYASPPTRRRLTSAPSYSSNEVPLTLTQCPQPARTGRQPRTKSLATTVTPMCRFRRVLRRSATVPDLADTHQ